MPQHHYIAAGLALALSTTGAAAQSPVIVPPGTLVVVALDQTLDSETAVKGQTFSLHLAEPVVVDGQIVLPAGALGEGQVVHAAKGKGNGAAGELILSARTLTYNGAQIRLDGLQLSAVGVDHSYANIVSNAVGAGFQSIAPIPGGPTAVSTSGQKAQLAKGAQGTAKTTEAFTVASLGAAAAPPATVRETVTYPRIGPAGELAKPEEGKALVVFFRPPVFANVLYPCTVHEDGQPIGALPNGRYFMRNVAPGPHTFTVKSERTNELPIELAAGSIYYVQCNILQGMIVRRPNLSPSSSAAYEASLPKMKPEEVASR